MTPAKRTKTVSQALGVISEQLRELSGYPDNTTRDDYMAFAYGYVMGMLSKAKVEWEEREHNNGNK